MMSWLAAIDPVAIRLFGWPVHWYGIIIGCGMVVAYYMAQQEAKRQGLASDFVADVYFWTIIFGIIGARTYYVVFRWEYYRDHLDQIVQIWNGGGAIYGAILAGAVTISQLTRFYQQNLAVMLDVSAPAVLAAQAIGRWGNFINQEAYGQVTTREHLQALHLPQWLIEQMHIQGQYYQPTFLYESLWSAIGVLMLMAVRRLVRVRPGEIAALYAIWYGIGRFWIEGLRSDSLYFGVLRVSQGLSAVLVVGALGWIVKQRLQPSDFAQKRGE